MLYEELIKKRSLVLLKDVKHLYVLYALSKQEQKDLESNLEYFNLGVGFIEESNERFIYDFLKQVNMTGCIDEVTDYHVKDIIPLDHINTIKASDRGERDEKIAEYPCYSSNKLSTIVHEDKLSSFKCACSKLQTKYFVVLKESIVEIIYGTGGSMNKEELESFEKMFKGEDDSIWKEGTTTITTEEIKQAVQDVILGATDHIKSENDGNI